jgi:hypothetical protein
MLSECEFILRIAILHPPDANSEFNLLNANLMVQAEYQFILDVWLRGCIKRWSTTFWRRTTKEGTVMMKSLLTGMAICAALAAFAGNAYAYKASIHTTRTEQSMSALTAKGGPLHDCVHVAFPQCSKGYGEPND